MSGRTWIAFLAAVQLISCRSNDKPGTLSIASIDRSKLAEGVEAVVVHLKRGNAPGGELHAVHAEIDRIEPELIINDKKQPISKLAPDAIVVTNAGFFTPEWRPTGLLISSGKTLNRFVPEGGGAGSGVFILKEGRLSLMDRTEVQKDDLESADLAIQAGPRVIEPTEQPGIRSDDGIHAHRTLVGQDRQGRFVLGVLVGPSGWKSGPTLFETQTILGKDGLGKSTAPELSWVFALNLDGGPSTGFHLRSSELRLDLPESSPVHSVLAVGTKPE